MLNNIHELCLVLNLKHMYDPDQHLCRGGVPICFPNVGPHLSLPTDGFLQDCHWSVAETAQSPPLGVDRAPQVTLMAESDESTLQIWPHQFYAAYTVSPHAIMLVNAFAESCLQRHSVVGPMSFMS